MAATFRPSVQPLAASVEVSLPTDKLRRRVARGGEAGQASHCPVVLVACGSYNPPTLAHLRMFDLAEHALTQAGYDVLGSYCSPVNDAYIKPGLLPAAHRVRMCELAAGVAPAVMVDRWEAAQPDYQRTLTVLQRVQSSLQSVLAETGSEASYHAPGGGDAAAGGGDAAAGGSSEGPGRASGNEGPEQPQPGPGRAGARVRSMLLCGADVVASFDVPGVWQEEDLRRILRDHGVVCIARPGTDVQALLSGEGTVLHELRDHVLVVVDPVTNALSSTAVRTQVAQGAPIRYLTPDAVVEYIRKHGLYASPTTLQSRTVPRFNAK